MKTSRPAPRTSAPRSAFRRCLRSAFDRWIALLAPAAVTLSLHAQTIPPGVPEPGLVIWGTVVNRTNVSQSVTITSATWSVTDGTKTAVYSVASRPATRIINTGGQSFYILEVPFDTRRIGTVTLADPATVGINSFELKTASPPTYILAPTINGVLATVHAIDGAPGSGNTFPVAGFTAATRGRAIRVDLAVLPPVNDFNSWATSFFGNPNAPEAARTADPDGDNRTNQDEFAAGTNPKDPNSALRILTVTLQPDQTQITVGWQSVSDKNYVIEAASEIDGPFADAGSLVPAAGNTTQGNVNVPPDQLRRFFRIRLGP